MASVKLVMHIRLSPQIKRLASNKYVQIKVNWSIRMVNALNSITLLRANTMNWEIYTRAWRSSWSKLRLRISNWSQAMRNSWRLKEMSCSCTPNNRLLNLSHLCINNCWLTSILRLPEASTILKQEKVDALRIRNQTSKPFQQIHYLELHSDNT